jgi:chromosome segregation ATPase
MVEPIMFLAIGFLLAALIGLGIVPLVHARAVRLTMKRLEASTPLSLAEIQADKDQLRAEFAMSARRLEMNVEQLKARTASQAAELGKKSDAVNRLKIELDDRNAAILALEEREKTLREELRTIDTDAGTKTERLLDAERELAEKRAEITKLTHELTDRTMAADSRQVELVAMNTQMELLKSRIESAEKDVSGTRERLEEERRQHATATTELGAVGSRAENLDSRAKELEGQLAGKTREAETLSDRIDDLETQLSGQGKMLAERETEANLLRQQVELGHKTERELRAALTDATENLAALREQARQQKADLEQQLDGVRAEMATAVTQAQGSWSTERTENAQLRERIGEIAAEVARLAIALEGPGSPIQTILAGTPNGKGGSNGASGHPGALAERIKALQAHVARTGRG